MAYMERQLADHGLRFERLQGIDGKALSDDQTQSRSLTRKQHRKRFFRPLSRGEIGCYESHRACWLRIVDEGLSAAVILEDDAELLQTFTDLLPELTRLSGRFEYIHLSRSRRGRVRLRPLDDKHAVVVFSRPPFTTVAQVVSASGARKLLKRTPPYLRPLDIDLQFPWEINELEVVSIWPPPTRPRGFKSEIGSRSDLPAYSVLAKPLFDSSLGLKSWVRLQRRFGWRATLNVALGREYCWV
jgi:glycosyl transferase family 25